jgi:hypothetical protein
MTQSAKNPVVHMKCRRGSDRATEGQTCKGMLAENLSQSGSHVAQFKCSSCGYVWSVPVGGNTPI